MFWSISSPLLQALAVIAFLASRSSQLVGPRFPTSAGFSNPSFSTSSGGFANCVSGIIKVTTTTKSNEKVRFNVPADEYGVTATFVHFLQLNSSQPSEVNEGAAIVSGVFDIAATICYPKEWSGSLSAIQMLHHGIGTDQSYWDFAKGYSFVDFAAQAGYPTFSYDRLGVGESGHPDPVQVVQASLQVEIVHTLISYIRDGKIGGRGFKNVVGVGHSFGSILCVGLLARYPRDLDGVVLTGFSMDTVGFSLSVANFDTAIASRNQLARFGNLPNGYLVWDKAVGNQLAFFSYPNFDIDSESSQSPSPDEVYVLTGLGNSIREKQRRETDLYLRGDLHYPVDYCTQSRLYWSC